MYDVAGASSGCHAIAVLLHCAALLLLLLLPCRLALCVQVYLKMDRPDKAEQQVKVRGLALRFSVEAPYVLAHTMEVASRLLQLVLRIVSS